MGNEASTLQPQVLTDLAEETGLAPDHIRTYYKAFMKECESGRMSMSKSYIEEQFAKVFPKGDAPQFAEHVFKVMDEDQNGRVDFREFMLAVSIIQNGSPEEKLKWTFDLFDIDGTGYITRTELVHMITELRSLRKRTATEGEPSSEEVADYLLDQADRDEDRKLSRKEFISGVRSSTTMRELIEAAKVAATRPLHRHGSLSHVVVRERSSSNVKK